ncbi:hypothetical protein PLICRDRAFT_38539 [Plicaturopsis crispa FD-325 SS-3]|nr:hypothetical protein PLICRDRAFT_38539 [Plicaturopsis crispa FD-325 SS-3]
MSTSVHSGSPGPSTVLQIQIAPQTTHKRSLSDAEEVEDARGVKRTKSTDEAPVPSSSREKKRRQRKRSKNLPVVVGAVADRKAGPSNAVASGSHLASAISAKSVTLPNDSNSLLANTSNSSTDSTDSSLVGSATSTSTTLSSSSSSPKVSRSMSHPPPPSSSDKGKSKEIAIAPATETHEAIIARLTQELADKTEKLTRHENVVAQMQQAFTCQICTELIRKPYALTPCGHVACYGCLVSWFKAPPAEGNNAAPPIIRKKTCPHCRAVVTERPVEVWVVKSAVGVLANSGLLHVDDSLPPAHDGVEMPADPWAGIFRKPRQIHAHPFPFDGFELPEHFAPPPPGGEQGQNMGMHDVEDGVWRCLDCLHELWDGVCSSCGRVYPGHGHHPHAHHHYDAEGYGDLDALEADDDPYNIEEELEFFGHWGAHHAHIYEPSDDSHIGSDDDAIIAENMAEHVHVLRHHIHRHHGLHDDVDVDVDEDGSEEDEDEDYESDFIDDAEDHGIPRHARPLRLPGDESGDEFDGSIPLAGMRVHPDSIAPRSNAIVEVSDDEDEDEVPQPRRGRSNRGPRRHIGRSGAIIVVSSEEEDGAPDGASNAATAGSRGRRRVVVSEDESSDDDVESSHLDNHTDFEGQGSGSDGEPDPDLADIVARREREQYGDDGLVSRSAREHASRRNIYDIDEDEDDDDEYRSSSEDSEGHGYHIATW